MAIQTIRRIFEMNTEHPIPAKIGAASNIGDGPFKVKRFVRIERTGNDYPPDHLVLIFLEKEVFVVEVIEQLLPKTHGPCVLKKGLLFTNEGNLIKFERKKRKK